MNEEREYNGDFLNKMTRPLGVHEVDPVRVKDGVVMDDIKRCTYCRRNDNVSVARLSAYAEIKGIPHTITCCEDCFHKLEIEESFKKLAKTEHLFRARGEILDA